MDARSPVTQTLMWCLAFLSLTNCTTSRQDTQPRTKTVDDVVMRVDTTHDPDLTKRQSQLVHEATEQAQQFLKEKHINLTITDAASHDVQFTDASTFTNYIYSTNIEHPTSTKPTALPPTATLSKQDSTLYTNAHTSVEHTYDELRKLDRLTTPNTTYTRENAITKEAMQARNTMGTVGEEIEDVYVNVPATILIHYKYDTNDIQTSPYHNGYVTTELASVLTHELGHVAGLIHPRSFPNATAYSELLDTNILTTTTRGNVMSSSAPTYNNNTNAYNYDLTPLQTRLWKQGLTESTQLHEAIKNAQDNETFTPIIKYYHDNFTTTSPKYYITIPDQPQ